VRLVEEADRDEDETAAGVHHRVEQEVEGGELGLDLSVARRRRAFGGGVLDLELGVQNDPVVELVSEVEDEAHEVEGVGAGLVGDFVVEVELAVAADREPVLDAVDLRGGRPVSVRALQLLGLG
jgi:hypothetical protein